jgi:alkaline phosphatase D
VGDYIYETNVNERARMRRHVSGLAQDLSLERFRVHHASYKLDADLRACHEAHPWLLTWDDHEVRNDYDGDHDNFGMSVDELLQVRARGYQAYFEHLPISPTRAPVGPNAQMHTRYSWGRLADIWLLDTRQYRSEQACTGLPKSFWKDKMLWHCDATAAAERSMLGRGQEHWLAESLAASRGAWRIIAQSTQMSPGTFKPPGADALLYSDGWDAFPAARERLMAAIAQPRVPDVVVLSGDVHRHVAANLRLHPTDPQSPIIASEFAASSISSRGLSEFLNGWMKRSNPDLLHLRGDERGYALIDVSPEQMRCDFRATAHPVLADARFHTQASYVVERGVAGPRKA